MLLPSMYSLNVFTFSSSASLRMWSCVGPTKAPPASMTEPFLSSWLRIRPPTRSRASTTRTDRPPLTTLRAATRPEIPPPTTTTSTERGSEPLVVAADAGSCISEPAAVRAPKAPAVPSTVRRVTGRPDVGLVTNPPDVRGGDLVRQTETRVASCTWVTSRHAERYGGRLTPAQDPSAVAEPRPRRTDPRYCCRSSCRVRCRRCRHPRHRRGRRGAGRLSLPVLRRQGRHPSRARRARRGGDGRAG